MSIKTILCIEDDRFIGEMYVRSLEKAGFTVEWMIDGADGLVAARNKTYDLIILDLMLPERRGEQVLDSLRNDKINLIPDTKILVLTNFEQSDTDREHVLKRVDGYFIKADITPRKLIEVIQELGQE